MTRDARQGQNSPLHCMRLALKMVELSSTFLDLPITPPLVGSTRFARLTLPPTPFPPVVCRIHSTGARSMLGSMSL